MVPSNTQLMGVQQSHQGDKINNTHIYTLLQCHLIQGPPTPDQRDCTNQTALRSTPRHGEVTAGKVTACGSSWGCRNAEAFRKKNQANSPKRAGVLFSEQEASVFQGSDGIFVAAPADADGAGLSAGSERGRGWLGCTPVAGVWGPKGAGAVHRAMAYGDSSDRSRCFPGPLQCWQHAGAPLPAVRS